MQMNKRQISVDAPLADSDNTSYIDILPNNLSTNTDNNLVLQSLRDEIACALNALNEREKNVIEAYFGINQPECTLEEIGQKYGLTRERVRQIREKAIRKLRQNTKNKILKTYLGQ